MPSTPEEHPDEELLAALAMGDVDDVDAQQRAHVARCAGCRDEVEALRRTALRVRASTQAQQDGPAPHVWEGVLRDVQADLGRPEAVRASSPASAPTRARRPAVLVAAVLLALALGAGVGAWWGRHTAPSPAPPVATDTLLAKAQLSEVDGTAPRGQAQVVRRGKRVELRVWADGLGSGTGLHEVWLLNKDGKRMVSLGMLGPGESGTFAMPVGLMSEGYVVVDVSLEPDDGNPAHSGDSLARGQLRAS